MNGSLIVNTYPDILDASGQVFFVLFFPSTLSLVFLSKFDEVSHIIMINNGKHLILLRKVCFSHLGIILLFIDFFYVAYGHPPEHLE